MMYKLKKIDEMILHQTSVLSLSIDSEKLFIQMEATLSLLLKIYHSDLNMENVSHFLELMELERQLPLKV
jgi:hypothetical protein